MRKKINWFNGGFQEESLPTELTNLEFFKILTIQIEKNAKILNRYQHQTPNQIRSREPNYDRVWTPNYDRVRTPNKNRVGMPN